MSKNMTTLDRQLRAFVVAPVAVLAGILVGPGAAGSFILYAVAAVMLATATVGFCPLYLIVRPGGRQRRLG